METWKESVKKMNEPKQVKIPKKVDPKKEPPKRKKQPKPTEVQVVIQRPTIKYELKRVVGGRAPKTEVTLKLSGDVSELGDRLVDKSYDEVLRMTRAIFLKELSELNTLLTEGEPE